ncbi:hypothetical protein IAE33_002810 [Pseudomonas sp. S60]|nr:hypothetical protein [Pseudomonas sp. S60]
MIGALSIAHRGEVEGSGMGREEGVMAAVLSSQSG